MSESISSPFLDFAFVDGDFSVDIFRSLVREHPEVCISTFLSPDKSETIIGVLEELHAKYFVVVGTLKDSDNTNNLQAFHSIKTNISDIEFVVSEILIDKDLYTNSRKVEFYLQLKKFIEYQLRNYRLASIIRFSTENIKKTVIVLFSPFRASGILNNALLETKQIVPVFINSGMYLNKDQAFQTTDWSFLVAAYKILNPQFVLSVNSCGIANKLGVFNHDLAKILANMNAKLAIYSIDKVDFVVSKITSIMDNKNIFLFLNRNSDILHYNSTGIKAIFSEWASYENSTQKAKKQDLSNKLVFIGNCTPLREAEKSIRAFEPSIGKDNLDNIYCRLSYSYSIDSYEELVSVENIYGVIGFKNCFIEYQRTLLMYRLAELKDDFEIYGLRDGYQELVSSGKYKKPLITGDDRFEAYNSAVCSIDFIRGVNIDSVNDRLEEIVLAYSLPLMCGYSKINTKNIFTENELYYSSPEELIEKVEYFYANNNIRDELINKYQIIVKELYSPNRILEDILEKIDDLV